MLFPRVAMAGSLCLLFAGYAGAGSIKLMAGPKLSPPFEDLRNNMEGALLMDSSSYATYTFEDAPSPVAAISKLFCLMLSETTGIFDLNVSCDDPTIITEKAGTINSINMIIRFDTRFFPDMISPKWGLKNDWSGGDIKVNQRYLRKYIS